MITGATTAVSNNTKKEKLALMVAYLFTVQEYHQHQPDDGALIFAISDQAIWLPKDLFKIFNAVKRTFHSKTPDYDACHAKVKNRLRELTGDDEEIAEEKDEATESNTSTQSEIYSHLMKL